MSLTYNSACLANQPRTLPQFVIDDADSFWDRLQYVDGCWLWVGRLNAYGYGVCRTQGRDVGAHRMAYQLTHGEIPAGQCVLHRCDTPRCCRPGHLFLGSHSDNVRDKVSKGRQAAGKSTNSAKLTPELVKSIRSFYADGGFSHRQLAKVFGIGATQIGKIIRRDNWKQV